MNSNDTAIRQWAIEQAIKLVVADKNLVLLDMAKILEQWVKAEIREKNNAS